MEKVIAVDGPSGVGKSTVSKGLAQRLGWTYLDTGAMYRTVTLAWLREGSQPDLFQKEAWLKNLDPDFQEDRVLLNGEDISKAIRTPEVTASTSLVSADPTVRRLLTDLQRRMASRRPCILDGRDIGTVVFPNAFFKIFLTASPEIRAERRWLQMGGDDSGVSLQSVLNDQLERDRKDSSRDVAPLRQAPDALVFDTGNLTQDEVVQALYHQITQRLDSGG